MDGWAIATLFLTVWLFSHYFTLNLTMCPYLSNSILYLTVCFKLNHTTLISQLVFYSLLWGGNRLSYNCWLLFIAALVPAESKPPVEKYLTDRWVGSTFLLSGEFDTEMYIMLQITCIFNYLWMLFEWSDHKTFEHSSLHLWLGITVSSDIITVQPQYCTIMFKCFVKIQTFCNDQTVNCEEWRFLWAM